MAGNSRGFSAAPNFSFRLAARKTTDADLAALDLGMSAGQLLPLTAFEYWTP
jgi:hypothetical protein